MNKISKVFYVGSIYGCGFLSIIIVVFGLFLLDVEFLKIKTNYFYVPSLTAIPEAAIILFLGFGMMIYSWVAWLFLVHRLWVVIQNGDVRTTPGRAVGFMFIPLWGWYWMYKTFWGWSVDCNHYIKRRGIIAPPVSEGVPLAYCILFTVSLIPVFTPIAFVAMFFLMVLWLNQSIDAANKILERGNL